MTVTLTARKLVERIRSRLVDDSSYWSDTEILETSDQQYVTFWDNLRRLNRNHNLDRIELAGSDFTLVEEAWREIELPGHVQDIAYVEAMPSSGEPIGVEAMAAETFNMSFWRRNVSGIPAWMRTQYGTKFSIFGSQAFESFRIWFVRSWPPMHFGRTTSNGVNASLILDTSGPAPGGSQAGDVIVADDAYVGLEVYIEDQDQRRRITGYTGATQVATFDPLPTNLSTGDYYSLIVPVDYSMQRYFQELVLQDLIMRLGNATYSANQALVIEKLELQMLHAGADRDRANPARIWRSDR